MRRYFDADKLKEIVDRQYKYCHGYTGTKKDIYREALLAIKSAIHCQSVSKDIINSQKEEIEQWQEEANRWQTLFCQEIDDSFHSNMMGEYPLIKKSLDLINRQKSEIEELNIQLRELWNMASLYKAEGERWESYNKNLLTANTALSNEILSAKAEAYKEFAEKAKEEMLNLQYNAKTDRIYLYS